MAEKLSSIELYEKFNSGEMDASSFLHLYGKEKFFYSTPFGEKKDGSKAFFVLQGPEKTGYLPVFSNTDRAKEFFEKANRGGYLLMQNTFHDILVTAKKANETAPLKLGIIVDPGYAGINIDVNNLDSVIDATV